jgi:dipeptidyl aminopeptidase/acylaminoacyl peptidase
MQKVFQAITAFLVIILACTGLSGCLTISSLLNYSTPTPTSSFANIPKVAPWAEWKAKAEKKLPPLIPLDTIFSAPEYLDPLISFDGKNILYRYMSKDASVDEITLMNIASGDKTIVPFPPNAHGIPSFFWARDNGHIILMIDNMGDENYGMYSVDIKSGKSKTLFQKQGVSALMAAYNMRDANEIYIGINQRDTSAFDLYRCNITSGDLNLMLENPGNITDWYFDKQGELRAVCLNDTEGGQNIMFRMAKNISTTYKASEWRQMIHWKYEDTDTSGVFGFSMDGQRIFIRDSSSSNTSRLVEMNVATGEQKVIAQDPQYDVEGYWLDIQKDDVTAVEYFKDHRVWDSLDDNMGKHIARLENISKGDFTFDSSEDDRYWLISYENDTDATSYYYYDSLTGESKYLFGAMPELKKYTLAPMQTISLRTTDGMAIQGYITFPIGLEKKDLPMVVLVHGGPWTRDEWGFNNEVQWLANRGYAVLQVNFRGSTGYGKAFVRAGDREWGAKMQQDLTDAVNWAVAQGYVDKARVAIYGASYGGYAALAGATFTPNVYACAVDLFGPSNLITLVNSVPDYWRPELEKMYRAIGNPATEEDFMKSRSPLFSVDKIKIPVLIAQGGNDVRVKPQESEQIVSAMKKLGLYVDYQYFPDSGHGFSSIDDRMMFYQRAETFLSTYIGGRAQEIKEARSQ